MLTLEIMNRRWPQGNQHLPALFPKYGLTSELVVAHFMAQASEECGQGLELVESGNYTATRLLQVFPSHFTPAMAKRAAHNSRLTFDIAYGGRMGNAPPPSDDGYNFRGRGLTQVTGREGYKKLGDKLGLDLIANPDLVVDLAHILECSLADYVLCGCLLHAENDDLLGETKALNGGTNGYAERRRQLGLWKQALGVGKPALAVTDHKAPLVAVPAAEPLPGANAP